jgi:hypothetical protein
VAGRGDGARRTVGCAGRTVTVPGHHNALTLRRACPRVTVTGSDDVLDVDSGAAKATRGHRNRVTYLAGIGGRVPGVDDTGERNPVGPQQ